MRPAVDPIRASSTPENGRLVSRMHRTACWSGAPASRAATRETGLQAKPRQVPDTAASRTGVQGYLSAHWRGENGLWLAFWVNFVALSALAWMAGPLLRGLVEGSPATVLGLAAAQFLLWWLVVYPWQLIGVVRSGERAVRDFRHGILARIAPVLAALGMAAAFPQGLALVQGFYQLLQEPPASAGEGRSYRLAVSADGRYLHLSGFLDFGVTRDFRDLLEGRGDIVGVVLDSGGGPVYEGRALGNVIRREGLDTYSLAGCSSACVTAFLGGRERWLAPGARLGFHQFRLDARNVHPFIDIEAEQRLELENYAARGVDRGFLARVFDSPHDDIWFPEIDELQAAGVIDGVLDEVQAERLAAGHES